uniref:NADH dehydrogenase subunit 2 n=1 Tax=Scolytoplatypus raja TaxID=2894157 RepID=UPI0023AAF3EF|nr:NADH dehydrogenase subunit 2 [Scolytoplatypus raja]WCB99774.1 NADH dehydrogenase subunit 2 [Scolytoplatypus raja]
MYKSYKILFIIFTLISTIISISANSWLIAWIGLEINLLSIMPLMKNNMNKYSSETMIKYFIAQAMASMMLLFFILISLNNIYFNLVNKNIINYMFSIPLLMKMGAAPFHFWFPEMMSGLEWNMALLILTWQKISPFILLFYLNIPMKMLLIPILASALTGSIMGFNSLCLRKMISYSSINHISWMLVALMNYKIWLLYFLIYSLMNFFIIMNLKLYNIFFTSQMSFLNNNKLMNLLFSMNLLSLGGLPPFIGFFPKLIVVNLLMQNNMMFLLLLMIMSTLINLFFYMRLILPFTLLNKMQLFLLNKNKNMNMFLLANFLTLSSTLTYSTLYSFMN